MAVAIRQPATPPVPRLIGAATPLTGARLQAAIEAMPMRRAGLR